MRGAPGRLPADPAETAQAAMKLAWTGVVDVLVFFAVLLVGFAYVWKRGDLEWVRTLTPSNRMAPTTAGSGTSTARPLPTTTVAS